MNEHVNILIPDLETILHVDSETRKTVLKNMVIMNDMYLT